MSNLALVYQRVEAGDRIRFFHDYYGRQWVELSRGWFLTHKTRVYLAPQEIMQLKATLRRRRPHLQEAGPPGDQTTGAVDK